MNILFICNQNQNRSKTAEQLLKDRYNTKSAGLFNEKPVTEKQIKWADTVIVMEDSQRSEIAKRFPELYMEKKILSLNIPDIYNYDQTELKELINSNLKSIL